MSKDRGDRFLPIALTIVVALMLSIAPMPQWAAPYRPDWVALTLIYWSMMLPRSVGVGVAWISGLLLDVATGTLLAQHALALSFIVYLTVKLHLQLRLFPMWQLAATVLALLATYRFILFWINGIAGMSTSASSYWGPVVASAIAWPIIAVVLRSLPQRERSSA